MKETFYIIGSVLVLVFIAGNVINYFKMKDAITKNLTETKLNWFFIHPKRLCILVETEQSGEACDKQCNVCLKLATNLRNQRLIENEKQLQSKP